MIDSAVSNTVRFDTAKIPSSYYMYIYNLYIYIDSENTTSFKRFDLRLHQ